MEDAELSTLLDALRFAADMHADQRRKDAAATPYINHPIRVMATLFEAGERDPALLAAALLHDVVEDTEATSAYVRGRFGAAVADIVDEVTDDKALKKEERKRLQVEKAPHKSPSAQKLKMADKICNLQDLLESPPEKWDATRQREYFDWADAVVAGLRHAHEGLAAQFDALYAQGRERFPG